jgi:hypothetical protein
VDSSNATLSLRSVFVLIIGAAAAMAVGRILSAERVYEPSYSIPKSPASGRASGWPQTVPRPMPTFSSNDRSRWATVRSLVDQGTYVVGKRDAAVLAARRSGPTHLVAQAVAAQLLAPASPPLGVPANILVAQKVTEFDAFTLDEGIVFEDGWQTVDKVLNPDTLDFYSSKPPLLTTMVAGEYWVLKQAFGWTLSGNTSSVVRVVLVTINVIPFILYLALLAAVVARYSTSAWTSVFILSAAAFGTLVTPFLITFNNHVIATFSAMVTLYALLRIWSGESEGIGWYALAGLGAGFTAVNELPAAAFLAGVFLVLVFRNPAKTLLGFTPLAILSVVAFLGTNYLAIGKWTPAYSEFGGEWYTYEGSHWRLEPGQVKRGIDWAWQKETRADYAFHLLAGHHGVFSLTPVFVLTFLGLLLGLGGNPKPANRSQSEESAIRNPQSAMEGLPKLYYLCVLLLSVVIVGFYLVKSDNYGGWSNGPRWLMWLTPLWLTGMIPAVDRLARCGWGRGMAIVLLAVSVMSTHYQGWNPWRHPWLYNFLDYRGQIPY